MNKIYYSNQPIMLQSSVTDAIPEELFKKDVMESTRLMMERLTTDEQMRVSFYPVDNNTARMDVCRQGYGMCDKG